MPQKKKSPASTKKKKADSMPALRAKARKHNASCQIPLFKHNRQTVTKAHLKTFLASAGRSKTTAAAKPKAKKSMTKGQKKEASANTKMAKAYSALGEIDANPEYAFDVGQAAPPDPVQLVSKPKKKKTTKPKNTSSAFGTPVLQADTRPVNILKARKKNQNVASHS
jgi:hypothetical protein